MAIKHFDLILQVDYILVKKKEKKEKKTYILNIASTLTTAELISTSSVQGMKQVIGPLTVSLVSRS